MLQGAEVGERFDPLRRVGIYVPAGTAPLVSTAVMTLSLAKAAGVAEIVAVSPVGPDKVMNPGLLTALTTRRRYRDLQGRWRTSHSFSGFRHRDHSASR